MGRLNQVWALLARPLTGFLFSRWQLDAQHGRLTSYGIVRVMKKQNRYAACLCRVDFLMLARAYAANLGLPSTSVERRYNIFRCTMRNLPTNETIPTVPKAMQRLRTRRVMALKDWKWGIKLPIQPLLAGKLSPRLTHFLLFSLPLQSYVSTILGENHQDQSLARVPWFKMAKVTLSTTPRSHGEKMIRDTCLALCVLTPWKS
jgi:hypothetical protein